MAGAVRAVFDADARSSASARDFSGGISASPAPQRTKEGTKLPTLATFQKSKEGLEGGRGRSTLIEDDKM